MLHSFPPCPIDLLAFNDVPIQDKRGNEQKYNQRFLVRWGQTVDQELDGILPHGRIEGCFLQHIVEPRERDILFEPASYIDKY